MMTNATGTEKYAFTGQYSEADIGLYYFSARWYDASLGRFISEDPLKGSMLSSQSQNPYVYCMNNPLRYVDPTGMMGDIPDWSLPDDYFNGYVSSVGSLINTVVNTATEFASGVNHGVAAGTTSASGSAGVPSPGTTYSPSSELGYGSGGQSYWDNGDINLPSESVTWRIDVTFSFGPGEINMITMHDLKGNWSMGYNVAAGLAYPGISFSPCNLPEYDSIEDYRNSGALSGGTTKISGAWVIGSTYAEKEGQGSFSPIFGTKVAGITVDSPYLEVYQTTDQIIYDKWNSIYGKVRELI